MVKMQVIKQEPLVLWMPHQHKRRCRVVVRLVLHCNNRLKSAIHSKTNSETVYYL